MNEVLKNPAVVVINNSTGGGWAKRNVNNNNNSVDMQTKNGEKCHTQKLQTKTTTQFTRSLATGNNSLR